MNPTQVASEQTSRSLCCDFDQLITLTGMFQSIFVQIFRLCGMCPLSAANVNNNKRKLQDKWTTGWSFLLTFVVVIYAVVVSSIHYNLISTEPTSLNAINILAKMLTTFATHILIGLESIWQSDHQCHFWRKTIQVDHQLDELCGVMNRRMSSHKQQFIRNYCRKLLTSQVFFIFVEISIIALVQRDRQWTRYWCLVIFSLSMTRLRYLQQTMFVDIVAGRLKVIRMELAGIVEASKSAGSAGEVPKRLFMLKRAYHTLYEITVHLNAVFGLSQLANLLQNFIQLASDLFWIYCWHARTVARFTFSSSSPLTPACVIF